MKKQHLVKFSLSLVCAAVLSACGSGGSGGAPASATGNTPSAGIQGTAVNDQTANELADVKKQLEEMKKQKQDQADTNEKPLDDKQAGQAAPTETNDLGDVPSFGHKFVKKNKSDFVLDGSNTVSSISSGKQDNMSIELHESLDTIVVSVPYKYENGELVVDADKIAYLEDFDFRKATKADLTAARTSGKTTLSHIYTTRSTSDSEYSGERTQSDTPEDSVPSVKIRNVTSDTKTETKGTSEGTALVYKDGQKIYIGKEEKFLNDQGAPTEEGKLLNRTNTVAEVYGHRTFVLGNAETGVDAEKQDEDNNAPLVAKNSVSGQFTEGGKLSHVQYGRVTSQLSGAKQEHLKEGIDTGNGKTYVAGYGEYGAKGTEDSYFYRGVGDTAYDAELSAQLANKYATSVQGNKTAAGSLSYQGHAVTYGLTHVKPLIKNTASGETANAVHAGLGALDSKLSSGTHVKAKIDLATKEVSGSLYDVWKVGDGYHNQDLVTFNGKLHNNGQIQGSSARVIDNAGGSFAANLYGKNAEELGGGVTSNATAAEQSWGAVFGAKVQNQLYTQPNPEVDAISNPGGAFGAGTQGNSAQ